MYVKVYLSMFGDDKALDEQQRLKLKDGATLGDAMRKLKVPIGVKHLPIVSVNNVRSKLSRKLEEGDRISFFSIHVGG